MRRRQAATDPVPPSGLARRLRRLPRARVQGRRVPVAASRTSRLLGLALLPRERAGAGLMIPRCRSVHTFGMRFPIDVVFLDQRLTLVALHRAVPARRVVSDRRASAVLELPASPGIA
jgi:uncharacterized membrane protein (UPF0127 family)